MSLNPENARLKVAEAQAHADRMFAHYTRQIDIASKWINSDGMPERLKRYEESIERLKLDKRFFDACDARSIVELNYHGFIRFRPKLNASMTEIEMIETYCDSV